MNITLLVLWRMNECASILCEYHKQHQCYIVFYVKPDLQNGTNEYSPFIDCTHQTNGEDKPRCTRLPIKNRASFSHIISIQKVTASIFVVLIPYKAWCSH